MHQSKMICKTDIYATLFSWLLAMPLLFAQTSPYQDPGYDTNYIKSFRDNLVVTAVTLFNSNTITVTDKFGDDVNFTTNVPVSFGLALDYKWLTVEYTTSMGIEGDPKYGLTENRRAGFGLTGRKLWFRNFYQSTRGYYLENPQYFNPDFNPATDVYPHRNDVASSVYYATLNYGFNHRRFSNMAALWQLERQKKSAGSFTAGLTFSYASFSADSALIGAQYLSNFNETKFVNSLYFTMMGVNGGYLYTFAMGKSKKVFISAALIPGLDYQIGRVNQLENEKSEKQYTIGTHAEFRLVFGYNGDKWYTAFSSSNYAVSGRFGDYNPFNQGYSFVRFVLGYKFEVPKTKNKFFKQFGL